MRIRIVRGVNLPIKGASKNTSRGESAWIPAKGVLPVICQFLILCALTDIITGSNNDNGTERAGSVRDTCGEVSAFSQRLKSLQDKRQGASRLLKSNYTEVS